MTSAARPRRAGRTEWGRVPVVRRGLPRARRRRWSCCCSFGVLVTLGVSGELEEHLLEAGAVGGAQLDEVDSCVERDLADELRVGFDAQRVRAPGGRARH